MSVARRVLTAAAVLAALAAAAPAAQAGDGAPAPVAEPAAPADPAVSAGSAGSAGQAGPAAWTRLVLSVVPETRGAARRVTLRCDPAGGRHPYAEEACHELAATDGAFEGLPVTRTMCPMIYQPAVAVADGIWHGRRVSWSREYANACVLARATGDVFRF